MGRNSKKSDENLFRESCVVNNGSLYMSRLRVSRQALVELKGFVEAWRDTLPDHRFPNGSRERLIRRFAVLSVHYAVLSGRRTVLDVDVILANGRIWERDFV